ncbi:MAG TPA: SDR family oxidoreductase [Eoetvoesiella sp.]
MQERVLITGGASGIGAAIAKRCEQDGYEPVIIDRTGLGILADLSDPEATAEALKQALRGGPITRLVNNVGIVCPASIEEQTIDELQLVWSLNVRCAMQCAQALLPGMKEQKFGRIVNISSRATLGKELRTAYAGAKAGLVAMAKVWALELGPHGITCNAIGPGPIMTELWRKANPPGSEQTKAIINSVPVRRVGTPDDVANTAAFLLDRQTGFVTGQMLYVCGGLTVSSAQT